MRPFHTCLMRCAIAALLLVVFPFCAEAGAQRVREVVNAKNVILEDGTQVRLASIQAPNLADTTPDGRARPGEPLGAEAKAALEQLVQGKTVRLQTSRSGRDRHGRTIAQLYDEQDRWIQCEMLRQGFALVYSFPDQRDNVPAMLACEREARAAKRGIWADPYYAILTPENAGGHLGEFALIEGVVKEVANMRGRTYVNFGENWRSDFTAHIARRDHRRFDDAALAALTGKKIRVRGWLYEKNGPMVDLTHPEQMEVLE